MDISQVLNPHSLAQILLKELPPKETCQQCGKMIPVRDHAINFAYSARVFIGSPGHPTLAPIVCHEAEHWACSPECWSKLAHKCIDEHITPALVDIHNHLSGSNDESS